MKKNITWKGLNRLQTIEYCELLLEENRTIASAVIEGTVDGREVNFSYRVHADANWRTLTVSVLNRIEGDLKQLVYTSDGAGNWSDADGVEVSNFKGCIEIDIMLSPFTNTLPLKRLKLKPGESQRISVLYFDVLKFEVRRVEQIYTRLTEDQYKYENTENDFSALIKFDAFGLVISYPGLFEMTSVK
jgi:hypothetical protein